MFPDDEEEFGGLGLEALLGYLSSPQFNVDKYGNEVPLTANNIANYNQDIFQMLTNPQTAMVMAALTGQPTVDYMQQPVDEEPAPVAFTPTLDALRLEDPDLASIVESGASYATLAKGIREANEDPEGESASTKDQLAMVQAAINERNTAAKEMAEFNARPVPLSPLEEQYRKAGVSAPWETYTADTVPLPEGFDDQTGVLRERLTGATRRAKSTERDYTKLLNEMSQPLPKGERVGPNGENLFLQQFKPGGRYGDAPPVAPEGAPWISHSFDTGVLDAVGRFLDDPAWDFGDNGKPPRERSTTPRRATQGSGAAHRTREQSLRRKAAAASGERDALTREIGRREQDFRKLEAHMATKAGRTPNRDQMQGRLALLRAAGIPI